MPDRDDAPKKDLVLRIAPPRVDGVLLMQHGIALNALRAIYALPCAHPDNPDEDGLLARQFAEAQRLAGDALGAVDA